LINMPFKQVNNPEETSDMYQYEHMNVSVHLSNKSLMF